MCAGVHLPELADAGDSQSMFLIFQPQLDNGLVLIVTNETGSTPLLAVGIFNGEVYSKMMLSSSPHNLSAYT